MGVGIKLKQLRKNKALTLEQLAEIFSNRHNSNIHKSMISNWENNKVQPSIDSLNMYTSYFNVSLDYLITGHKSNNLLGHFNAVSDYMDKYPYHLLYFPKEYKQELYNKLKELDTENYLSKDFSIYSTAEEFWTAVNYFDLDIDDSKLIQIKPEDKEYYIDYTIYNEKQLLELDTITKMVVSLFERQNNFTEENKKMLKKFISDFYKKII